MGKENLTFSDNEIGKDKFNRYKRPNFLEDVDIETFLVKENCKYFIVYLYGDYKINKCVCKKL